MFHWLLVAKAGVDLYSSPCALCNPQQCQYHHFLFVQCFPTGNQQVVVALGLCMTETKEASLPRTFSDVGRSTLLGRPRGLRKEANDGDNQGCYEAYKVFYILTTAL